MNTVYSKSDIADFLTSFRSNSEKEVSESQISNDMADLFNKEMKSILDKNPKFNPYNEDEDGELYEKFVNICNKVGDMLSINTNENQFINEIFGTYTEQQANRDFPGFDNYPNISVTGSLIGMKTHYGWDTSKVIKVGSYYYNIKGHPNLPNSNISESFDFINQAATDAGLDLSKYNREQIEKGLDVEAEHGGDKITNITNDDLITTLKIVLAHLDEVPDYYDKLEQVEKPNDINEANDRFTDEIGDFWVVTKPTKDSLLQDICFKTNILGFVLQCKGGLKSSEINGIYKSENSAKSAAEILLKNKGIKEDKQLFPFYYKGSNDDLEHDLKLYHSEYDKVAIPNVEGGFKYYKKGKAGDDKNSKIGEWNPQTKKHYLYKGLNERKIDEESVKKQNIADVEIGSNVTFKGGSYFVVSKDEVVLGLAKNKDADKPDFTINQGQVTDNEGIWVHESKINLKIGESYQIYFGKDKGRYQVVFEDYSSQFNTDKKLGWFKVIKVIEQYNHEDKKAVYQKGSQIAIPEEMFGVNISKINEVKFEELVKLKTYLIDSGNQDEPAYIAGLVNAGPKFGASSNPTDDELFGFFNIEKVVRKGKNPKLALGIDDSIILSKEQIEKEVKLQ